MSDDREFCELLDDHIQDKNLWCTESTTGVRNLCRIIRALGYKNFQNFGQFDGGCYGDLIDFLEDNSGAVESIIDWIREEGGNDDWEDNLRQNIVTHNEEELENK